MNVVAPVVPDLDALIAGFSATAAQRDRTGGHAATEKAQIRQAGLLAWPVPAEQGGAGKGWPEILRLVRRIATADGSLAHLYGYHALQVGTIRLYANPEQAERLLGATAREHLWWGNANNPLDARLVAEDAADGGFVLDGRKGFASGARGSRHLNVSALHQASGQLILVTVPTDAPGVTVRGDWDAVGQRQTDSGTVEFEQVRIPARDVLRRPGEAPRLHITLRTTLSQLVLVNLFLGHGLGALAAARDHSLRETRPWGGAGVASIAEDPFVLARHGELRLALRAAELATDAANDALEWGWELGAAITPEQRGGVALRAAEARVLAQRAALKAGEELFELTGARAARAELNFDRFWRNIRTHSLHDPVDYKLRDIGRHSLTGAVPEPGFYA
ncbi:hypothetical protein EOD42_22075 [Rhodovarius crocodyli]|uniref:Dibenzothiophene monooxygenase n=1 Tax=Rhodovarius crocodyli TaxID=1979269 RepID=A0A437M275_9PROT|nr:acyl-CoA dehydrogenase family protein [Rhodovarius crocodyli]RVT91653.1 hypothetical protein EOD42_22075 [Rhodovarius crocodyli]